MLKKKRLHDNKWLSEKDMSDRDDCHARSLHAWLLTRIKNSAV